MTAASPTPSGSELTPEVTTGGAGRHRLQRGHAKAFVEGRKRKRRGSFIENPQCIDGNKAEKPDHFVHAALHDSDPEAREAGTLVADDDEPQVFVERVIGELAPKDGK